MVPSGWVLRGFGEKPEFSTLLTREGCSTEPRCALLEGRTASDSYGTLMQTFYARPFRGRRVRLRASVRTQMEGAARAGLWLRSDRKDRVGFVDHMRDRPITVDRWQDYEIVGDVSPDAETISLGLWLMGRGRAWIDSLKFEPIAAPKP